MRRVEITFVAELTEEELEDLEGCDPALTSEYLPEMAEKAEQYGPIGVKVLG